MWGREKQVYVEQVTHILQLINLDNNHAGHNGIATSNNTLAKYINIYVCI